VRFIVVVLQVSTLAAGALVIAAVGAVIFWLTTVDAVPVQPLAPVTVTVYVPVVVAEIVA
jgi:hypothetical protein